MSKKIPDQVFLANTEAELTVPKIMGRFSNRSPEFTYFENTQQNIIIIPEDRLTLYARDFEKDIENKTGIISNLGLSISILLALCTSDFHDFFWVPAAWVQKGFLVIFSISMWVFIWKGGRYLWCYFCKSKKHMNTPEDFVRLCRFRESEK